jgi:hypothetical protein
MENRARKWRQEATARSAQTAKEKMGRGRSRAKQAEWSHECGFSDKTATVTPRYNAIARLTLFASTPGRAAHKLLIEIPRSANDPMTTR